MDSPDKPKLTEWVMGFLNRDTRLEALQWAELNDAPYCKALDVMRNRDMTQSEKLQAMVVFLLCAKCELERVLVDRTNRAPTNMIPLPSMVKDDEGRCINGPTVLVLPESVNAIEGRSSVWHSFRPSQVYSVLHLNEGESLNVNLAPEQCRERLSI